jgi:hypothetical protein
MCLYNTVANIVTEGQQRSTSAVSCRLSNIRGTISIRENADAESTLQMSCQVSYQVHAYH